MITKPVIHTLASVTVAILIGGLFLSGCVPPETVIAPPVDTSPSPATSSEQGQAIKDLAYIKVLALPYTDDADPEDDGIALDIMYYDSKSELIDFRGIPVVVTIQLYGYTDFLDSFQHEEMDFIGETQVTVDHSMRLSEMFGEYIRIPFENIMVDQDRYEEYGTMKGTVTTPEQGDFEAMADLVRLYPAPIPEPEPEPEPEAEPESFPTRPQRVPKTDLEVTELNYVRSEWGSSYFLGFIKNVSNSAVEGLRVTLTVYDKAGVLLAQDIALVFPSLRPGERHPFKIGFGFEPLESYARHEIDVEAYPYRGVGMMLCPELKVISEQWEEEGRITGTLQNTSDRTAEGVCIYTAGYDRDGKFIAFGSGMAATRNIESGVTTVFEVIFFLPSVSSVTDYEFFISAWLK